jgi:hypothetical protein
MNREHGLTEYVVRASVHALKEWKVIFRHQAVNFAWFNK